MAGFARLIRSPLIAATLAVLGLAGVVAVALPSMSIAATAARARHHPRTRHELCSKLVPLGAIANASGLSGLQQLGDVIHWHQSGDGFWTLNGLRGGPGSLPGSECFYDDPTPNTSYTQQEFGTLDGGIAYVTVGYGETHRHWRALSNLLAANGGSEPDSTDVPSSGINGNAPESPLDLGHDSKSFLNTGDLVAAGAADPTNYPQFPSYFYIVTVLTRRDNVLQIGMYGASLDATEAVVENILEHENQNMF